VRVFGTEQEAMKYSNGSPQWMIAGPYVLLDMVSGQIDRMLAIVSTIDTILKSTSDPESAVMAVRSHIEAVTA
jgi:hypothetical protein